MLPSVPWTRLLSAAAALAGLVHIVAPRALLGIAAQSYDRVLAVDFEPREDATRRVRAIGLLFLAVGAELARRSD